MKMKILVSACLLGENCKYNGLNNENEEVKELSKYFELVPVCPECFGGLTIPREPCELRDERVYTKSGIDVTNEFTQGAEHCLYIAKEANCPAAVLKERSPSCGFGEIYDGSFSGKLIEGNGVTAQLLNDNEILVLGETKVHKILDLFYNNI